jgi:hypothetical protein
MSGCVDTLSFGSAAATTTKLQSVAGGSIQTNSNCTATPNVSKCNFVELPWGIWDICVDDANPTSANSRNLTKRVYVTPTGSTPAPTTGEQTFLLDGLPAGGLCP